MENRRKLFRNQNLIALCGQTYDKIISDGGYKVDDYRIYTTRDSLLTTDCDERITVYDAIFRRGLTLGRQTQERLHGYLKRFKWLSGTISSKEIWKIPYVWDIMMAQMVHDNVVLMHDDDNLKELVARLIDMRYVVANPADIYHTPKYEQKENEKNQEKEKKKKMKKNRKNKMKTKR